MMQEQSVSRMVVGGVIAAAIAQLAFARYRFEYDPGPPVLAIAVALVFLLPLLGELSHRVHKSRWLSRPLGIVFGLLGIAGLWAAITHPVMTLFNRVGLPGLLLSIAGLLLVEHNKPFKRVACLLVFVISVALLEVDATQEAIHTKELRDQGIMAHWH